MSSKGRRSVRNLPSAGAALPADKRIANVGVVLANSRLGRDAARPASFHSTAKIRRALDPLSPPTTSTLRASAPGTDSEKMLVSHSVVKASPCQGTWFGLTTSGLTMLSHNAWAANRGRVPSATASNSISLTICNSIPTCISYSASDASRSSIATATVIGSKVRPRASTSALNRATA